MILKIFTIKDSKAEIYMQPFFQKTIGEAERSFTTLAQDQKSTVSMYPEDYDLYYLGEMDDQTGKIQSLDTPSHVVKACNLKIGKK